jgi:hypothetical protein
MRFPELAATLDDDQRTHLRDRDRAIVAKQLRALRCWRLSQHTNDEKASMIRVMVVWKAHLSR